MKKSRHVGRKIVWVVNPPAREKMFKEGRCQQKTEFYQTNYPPLTLAYLAAILKKKFFVRVIDGSTGKHNKNKLLHLYKNDKVDYIFVNSTTPTINSDIGFVRRLLRIRPCKVKLFGIHASFMRNKYKKEGIEILKQPESAAYKLIGEKMPRDLDRLPFPSWNYVDLSNYKLPVLGEKFVLLQSSRGCPYDCIFCTNSYYNGKKVNHRSVDSVISELKYIKRMGIRNVIFFADTFTLDNIWVEELCKKIIKERLLMRFSCNSRVDTVNDSLLKIMKKAGFWLISFGIESGKQEILNKARKRITLDQIRTAVNLAYRNNLLTLGHFILGLPSETKETILKTISFSKNLHLDFAMFYIATPFPGSKLYDLLKKERRITSKNWDDFEYSKNIVNPFLDLERMKKKAYADFYFSNKIRRINRIIKIIGLKYLVNCAFSALSFIKIYNNSSGKR